MKNLFVAIAVTAGLSMLAISAQAAAPNWYAGLNIGYAVPGDMSIPSSTAIKLSLENSASVAGAIGYSVSSVPGLRGEFELGYQSFNADKISVQGNVYQASGSTSSVSYMANAYYNLLEAAGFSPYITGGAGCANLSMDGRPDSADNTNATVFAWQVGAGLTYDITPTIAIDGRYRYFATADGDFNGTDLSLDSNTVSIGVLFRF